MAAQPEPDPLADHTEPIADDEPANEIPLPAKGPGRGSRVPFGRQATRELTGLPVIVAKRFAEGSRNVYRWIGQFDEWIPDKGAVLERYGGGRFRLECPEGGRQYWDIAERHRAIHGRPTPAPTAAPLPGPGARAEPAGLPMLVAQLHHGQGQISTMLTRLEGRMMHFASELEGLTARIEQVAAGPTRPAAWPGHGPAPAQHHAAPAPVAAPQPAPTMLDQLQGIVALKKTLDDLGGLFGTGGPAAEAEPASEWSWLAEPVKAALAQAAAGRAPGMAPGGPPPPPGFGPAAAPLATVPPVVAPTGPTVAPVAQGPPSGPILAGSTPELEAEFDGLAGDLGYTPEQARYYALSQGWSLPEAVAYGRAMLADEQAGAPTEPPAP